MPASGNVQVLAGNLPSTVAASGCAVRPEGIAIARPDVGAAAPPIGLSGLLCRWLQSGKLGVSW